MQPRVSFWNTATGHLVVSTLVTAGMSILTALVNDAALAQSIGVGGGIVTVVKLLVDILNKSIPNL